MPMPGFSENDVPLAIGYYLGLRWFQAVQLTHDQFSFSVDMNGVSMQCGCGDSAWGEDLADLSGWYANHHTGSGVSLNGARARWEPGINHATCPYSTHRVPDRTCGCGFWAYWKLGQPQTSAPFVAALVKASGKIVEGPVGFRSATAEILALVAPPHELAARNLVTRDMPLMGDLAAAYKVPVYPSIEDLVEEYPASGGQPPLGDNYFRKAQSSYSTGGTVFSSGSGNTSSITHGYAGGNITGYSGGFGAGWNTASVHSVLSSGALSCTACGTNACSIGQALCACCQLAQITARLAPAQTAIGTGMADLKEKGRQATTGTDALKQLADRKAAWAAEPKGIMGPPDPPKGVSGIDSTGRRNPRGYALHWIREYIKHRYGRG